jgi:hypothetical protein
MRNSDLLPIRKVGSGKFSSQLIPEKSKKIRRNFIAGRSFIVLVFV